MPQENSVALPAQAPVRLRLAPVPQQLLPQVPSLRLADLQALVQQAQQRRVGPNVVTERMWAMVSPSLAVVNLSPLLPP